MNSLLFCMMLLTLCSLCVLALHDWWVSRTLSKRELEIIRSICIQHLKDYYTILDKFDISRDEFKKFKGVIQGVIDFDCNPLIRITVIIDIVGHEDLTVKSMSGDSIEKYIKQN